MNIKELAEQAGYTKDMFGIGHWDMPECIRFAELVRQDERVNVYNNLISGDCDGSVKAYIRKILEQST